MACLDAIITPLHLLYPHIYTQNHLLSRDKMTSYCYKIERCFDDDVMPAPVSSEESVPGLISRPLRDTVSLECAAAVVAM